jgi:hypothetical protein
LRWLDDDNTTVVDPGSFVSTVDSELSCNS